MKIPHIIIALLAVGFLGQSAFGSDNNSPLCLALTQDGHGGTHFMYHQTYDQGFSTASVALLTSSGGMGNGNQLAVGAQEGPLPDNGDVKFVIGTNQHGQANSADIPMTSHFAPAGQ